MLITFLKLWAIENSNAKPCIRTSGSIFFIRNPLRFACRLSAAIIVYFYLKPLHHPETHLKFD
jgi:hypothetical protein